jgi:hypothetical protein
VRRSAATHKTAAAEDSRARKAGTVLKDKLANVLLYQYLQARLANTAYVNRRYHRIICSEHCSQEGRPKEH